DGTECRVAERGRLLAGPDHRPAGARAGRHPRLDPGAEGHPEALLEAAHPGRHATGGEADFLVAVGALAEPDHHQAPVELIAEAPAQPRDRGPRRVGPRACRIGEVPSSYLFHLPNVSEPDPPALSRR